MVHELKIPFLSALTEDTHVLPDFHGNRYEMYKPMNCDLRYLMLHTFYEMYKEMNCELCYLMLHTF